MMTTRRVAAHIVDLGHEQLHQAYVTICHGEVVDYAEFTEEIPMTEWLGGTIEIRQDECQILRAYWNGKLIE